MKTTIKINRLNVYTVNPPIIQNKDLEKPKTEVKFRNIFVIIVTDILLPILVFIVCEILIN
ncbi:hypothetical protein JXB41_00090 [Candidatus Woesearchaeota archaeon]|nr:hypothetical protein [Candidatus Woesearchaeota archaeon]